MNQIPVQSDVILEARNIVRRYPGNVALNRVSFALHRHKVNVLIGENGAGKSTLMRILAGIEQPDEGEILFDGKPVAIRSPRDASALGIAIVHQELATLPNLDVSENVFAGRELLKGRVLVDRATEDRRTDAVLRRLHHALPLHRRVSQLSLGCRQILEIARTLAHGAMVLILDEPTSALSTAEVEMLFTVIEELKAADVTIVYISHRLHELLHLGDHFTVFRAGQAVGQTTRAEVTKEWIVERMSGRLAKEPVDRPSVSNEPVVLRLNHLTLMAEPGENRSTVQDVTFSLRRGEIVGVYGLLGAGRTELLEALAGNRTVLEGLVEVNGKAVHLSTVRDAIRAGIVLVPEDRQRDGLIPELSIRENIALAATSGPVLSRRKEAEIVRTLIRDLHIAVRDIELPVAALSGGNQQKVLLARCLMRHPLILMLDEPTRGIDIGSKAEIYSTLRALAGRGLTILFASSEIEETRRLADRVLVMREGRIAAEFDNGDVNDDCLFATASPHVKSRVPLLASAQLSGANA